MRYFLILFLFFVDQIHALTSLRGSTRSHHLRYSHQSLFTNGTNFSKAVDEEEFYILANATSTDKVSSHRYSDLYGQFLLPYIRKKREFEPNEPIKFLEIGFGCTMAYGAGESVKIWKKLFTERDSLWEAEYWGSCVDKWKNDESLKGINFLVGDQSNSDVLDKWIAQSGGKFDIIIDDASHKQDYIYASFMKLWPEIIPGGIYFIEDLLVARDPNWRKKAGGNEVELVKVNMVDLIYAWIEQLVVPAVNDQHFAGKTFPPEMKIPSDIRMISCAGHACAILKCYRSAVGPISTCS